MLNIYQYWDSPDPPDEVLESVRAIEAAAAEARLTLLDRRAAEAFIRRHQGPRALAAFRACGPAAMQADYLRLCLMHSVGGLYLDVDLSLTQPLAGLVAQSESGILITHINIIQNNVIYFERPGHPFISTCLELATRNIESKTFNDVLLTTGPGLFTAVHCSGDANLEAIATYILSYSPWNLTHWRTLLDQARETKRELGLGVDITGDLRLLEMQQLDAWVTDRAMDYKSSASHWANWPGSIYR